MVRLAWCIVLFSLVLIAHANEAHKDEHPADAHATEAHAEHADDHHDEHAEEHHDEHHDDHHEDDHHKREHDGLSDEEHEVGDDHHHNPEYDHDSFLGKDEADEFDKLTPEESKEKLAKLYDEVDGQITKDGFVTADELSKWIEHTQKRFVHSDNEKMHEYNDVNKDGHVTWDEYVKVTYTDDKEADPKHSEESKARDEPRFKLADKNADGKLDKDEFNSFLHPEHHDHMKPLIVKETINDIDTNKDGFISYEEYMNDMWPQKDRPKNGSVPDWVKKIETQFHEKRDANKDGKLDEAEVKTWVLPDIDEHVHEEANHLIKEADADKDGKITKEEMLEKWDVFVGSNQHGQTSFSDIINSERDEL